MNIFDLPDNNFAEAEWDLPPVQGVTVSPWTEAEAIEDDPWQMRWTCKAPHVPIVGEANVRAWRALLRKLGGRAGRFRLQAVEVSQHGGSNPRIASPAFTLAAVGFATVGAASISRSGGTDGHDQGGGKIVAEHGSGIGMSFANAAGGFWAISAALAEDPSASLGLAAIQFGLSLFSGGFLYSNLAGTTAELGTASSVDILSVSYAYRRIFFWKNGRLIGDATADEGLTLGMIATIHNSAGSIDRIGYGLIAPGGSTLALTGLPVSAQLLPAGAKMTIPMAHGHEKLVELTEPLIGDGSGNGTATFSPPLDGSPVPGATVETKLPWALMALDGSAPIRASAGQQYNFTLACSESLRAAA